MADRSERQKTTKVGTAASSKGGDAAVFHAIDSARTTTGNPGNWVYMLLGLRLVKLGSLLFLEKIVIGPKCQKCKHGVKKTEHGYFPCTPCGFYIKNY